MIHDVGEVLPLAKKHVYSGQPVNSTDQKQTKQPSVTLHKLWPEPNWMFLHMDGVQPNVLAIMYAIYHSLAKRPHQAERYRFRGRKVTLDMWREAYQEVVLFLKQRTEQVVSLACIEQLKQEFANRFSENGGLGYKAYAAGQRTRRTFFHPLKFSGPPKYLAELLPILNWPLKVNAKNIPLFPVQLTSKSSHERYFVLAEVNKRSVIYNPRLGQYQNRFSDYQSAVKALISVHGEVFRVSNKSKQKTDSSTALYIPTKPTTQFAGVPDDYADKTAEELMTVFHFRGVQFGNYVRSRELQSFVNNTFEALLILCNLLKVSPRMIGGDKLGIAFGARGQGHASAHYEQDLHIINLTRFNGPGCISHEIFHCFDRRVAFAWLQENQLLSELIAKNAVDETCVSGQATTRYLAFKRIVDACTTRSDYVKNAIRLQRQKGARKYWNQPAELCARGFEAFIQDQLLVQGIDNQWLSSGTRECDYELNGMHPYPTSDDRVRISDTFLANIPIVFGSKSN